MKTLANSGFLIRGLTLAATLCLGPWTECVAATIYADPHAALPACSRPAHPGAIVQVVDTVVDQDVVSSPISNTVVERLQPLPAVVAPLDTVRLQAANRITSGLLSGKLTMDEATALRLSLDEVVKQEDEFKLADCGLTVPAASNLLRKYHMVNRSISDAMDNSNTADYMPNVENRRAAIQNRIVYHQAAGNLTPGEAEQLLTALNTVSEHAVQAQASGDTVSADELEQLHRELKQMRLKICQKVNGAITVLVPDTVQSRERFLQTISTGMANCLITPEEGSDLMRQYRRLAVIERAVVKDEGPRSPDLKMLAAEIDGLNFILQKQLRDRRVAGFSTRY